MPLWFMLNSEHHIIETLTHTLPQLYQICMFKCVLTYKTCLHCTSTWLSYKFTVSRLRRCQKCSRENHKATYKLDGLELNMPDKIRVALEGPFAILYNLGLPLAVCLQLQQSGVEWSCLMGCGLQNHLVQASQLIFTGHMSPKCCSPVNRTHRPAKFHSLNSIRRDFLIYSILYGISLFLSCAINTYFILLIWRLN